jgi:hypothetical protein
VEIRNLHEVPCPSAETFTKQVAEAKARRATESTERNLESSRSHGIGIVKIGPKKSGLRISSSNQEPSDGSKGEALAGPEQMAGVLYIIDLAGSERMADSKNVSCATTL